MLTAREKCAETVLVVRRRPDQRRGGGQQDHGGRDRQDAGVDSTRASHRSPHLPGELAGREAGQVHHVGVEPGTGADDVARGCWRTGRGAEHGAAAASPCSVSNPSTSSSSARRRSDLLLVVLGHALRARRGHLRALTSSRWIAALRASQLLEDQVAASSAPDQVLARARPAARVTPSERPAGSGARRPGRRSSARAARCRGSCRGSRGRRRSSVSPSGLERLAELLGVDPSVVVVRSPSDADDVVRRLRARRRDHVVARSSWPPPAGLELEVLLTEQVEHLDRGLALGCRTRRRCRPRRTTITLSSSSSIFSHPAGAHAADLDHVARVQAAGVGELGVVTFPAEARELGEVERGSHHQQHA